MNSPIVVFHGVLLFVLDRTLRSVFSGGGGGGGGGGLGGWGGKRQGLDRETMFSQLAKRSPLVMVSRYICFSCTSYLSFSTEIAGESKTEPR